MGKVVDASVFWVWGSRAFVRDTSTDELSARAIPCVILGFPPDVLSWQFYHPTFRRVHPSQDVTFDESVPFYRLFPYRSAPLPPPPLFLVPVPPPVDPLPPQGPAPSGAARGAVSGGDVSGSSASRGAEPARAEPGGAEPGGTEPAGAKPRGAEPEGAEPGVAESEGAESEVSEPRGTASSGGPAGASPRQTPRPGPLSPQQLREWFSQRTRLRSGATEAGGSAAGGTGAGGAGATSLGGAGVPVGAGGTGGAGATSPGGTRARDPGAGGAGARGTGAGDPVGTSVRGTGARGARAVDPGAGGAGAGGAASGGTGAGGTLQRRPFFVPPPLSSLPPPYSVLRQTDSPSERREPASHPALPVRAVRTSPSSASSSCPWLSRYVTLSFLFHCAFLCRLLPSPLFLPFLDPESDLARAASPTVSRLLATVVTDPSFESTAASALVAELVDFAAACRLDYATSLVAESECDYPPSVGGECALGTDVLEDRQEDFECLVAAVPHLVAMLLAPEGDPDAPDIPTLRSYAEAITGTYVVAVPPSGANIVDGMWIFRVKLPPGSPPVFKAHYVARGFSQRQGVDFFQTFSPTPKMATLRVLLHVAAQRDYELSLDFSTAFLKSSLHEEIWLRRPPSFTGSFPAGIHRNLRRPVYGLRQAPREWHDTLRTTLAALGARRTITLTQSRMVHQVLQRFGFRYSWPQSTPLPTGHSLSAPPLDESVEPSGPYPEVVGCLITSCMGLVLGGRGPVVLTGHANASWGLWGFFDGMEKKLDNESGIAAWKKKDQKAFATLISRIGINLVSSVRMCIKLEASAHEAWKRLETMHVNKTLHGKILARNAFYMVKMRADESMHEYATRVEELGETFMDLGGMVTEEDWILNLLCGLPEEWSMVITTLDSVQDTWTKEMVVGRLLHEESRRRQFANESEGAAMFSRGSSGKKSTWSKGATKKSSGRSDRGKRNTSNGSSKCHYCGKAGHFWRECRKRLSDWTPSKARNHEGNAHTASGNADDARESIILLASDGTNTPSSAWFLDTGATQLMTHSASYLTNVGAPRDLKRVVFGNDKSLPVVGVGSTCLIVDGRPVDITNVLHVPGLKVNLLSITQLAKKGVKVTIDDTKMNLFWKGKQFAQGVLNGELYQLKTHPRVASSNVAQGSKATLKVWHNRLAHANYDSVKELANNGLAKGFDVAAGADEKGVCAVCVEGKMARKPFGSRTSPLAKDPLALVHMDVCGPMLHTSKGGARFLLVMLDDATCMCWTRLLKAKGDVTKAIQEWALEVCDDDKKRIKAIRTDGGGEFVNAELEKWMKSKGIKHDVTTPYTPQHNGAAEWLNRTLVEAVRSLLQHSKLGNERQVPDEGTTNAATHCRPSRTRGG
ncbi:unnamed protein product [Closterium sp. NIES-54]